MIAPLMFSPRFLEERIKQAYLRRQPTWVAAYPRSRVWAAAAGKLLAAHTEDPILPLDPELFVASQPVRHGVTDPWRDLTSDVAIDRYRRRVRAIIRQLRHELKAELRWARRRLDRGADLDLVLNAGNRSLTPLVRYIIAIQELREDLALSFVDGAITQHHNCPLYRVACIGMLPDNTYPADLQSHVMCSGAALLPLYSLN